MPENTFDIVSKVELPEVVNSIQQAMKEITQRYDLKGSHSNIELNEKENTITLTSGNDFQIKAVLEILQGKLVKRQVPLKALSYGNITPAAGSTVRQTITLQQGIPTEAGREIVKFLKDKKLRKVQPAIQGDQLRISSPSRDELQSVIGMLREHDFGVELQFGNFRE